MSWRKLAGVVAVLAVIGVTVGAVATMVTANGLLRGTALQIPAVVTLGLVAVGLAGIVLLGGPSREWFGNPYW